MLSGRQEEILALLREQPRAKTQELLGSLGISRARLNIVMAPLIKKKLVRKMGKARATAYCLTGRPNIELIIKENWGLRRRVRELEKNLDDRKIIERAKEILIAQFGILPTEAYRKLQEQSMRKRRPMRETAEAIVSAYEY